MSDDSSTTDVVRRSRGNDRRLESVSRSDEGRSGRVRRGLEGGLLATVVMTVFRMPVTRSLPPTAEFWAKFVGGGDPSDYPVRALVLHLVYGTVAGGLFAAMLPHRDPVEDGAGRGPPSRSGEPSATLYGFAYGVLLSVVGDRVVLGAILDVEPDDRFAFHVGHVIYGLALGEWVGTRTREQR